MALLTALSEIFHTNKSEHFHCLHIEHGIRPSAESMGDAESVRNFCSEKNIPLKIISIPHGRIAETARSLGIGTEAAARLYRHRALHKEALKLESEGKKAKILIAHTHNDKLETILMRVLRGAGPEGLSAMPQNCGRILRPLITLDRAEILAYLQEKNVPWQEDASNSKEIYLRNKIRLSLVPLLNDKFPGWQASLDAFWETQKLCASLISGEAANRIIWHKSRNSLYTTADTFFSQPQIIREQALFCGINIILKKKNVTIKRSTVRIFCKGECKTVDFGSLRAVIQDNKLLLIKCGSNVSEQGFSMLIKEPGLVMLKGVTIDVRHCLKEEAVQTNTVKVLLPLVLRNTLKTDKIVNGGKLFNSGAKERQNRRCLSLIDRQGVKAIIETPLYLTALIQDALE